MNALEHNSPTDFASDSSLLEGLYQLRTYITGPYYCDHTDGWEFEQLDSVVYERLKHAYAVTN